MKPGRILIHIIVLNILVFYPSYELLGQKSKLKNDGFAVCAGLGTLFSGGGIMADYQISFSDKLKLNPFISGGSQGIFTSIPGNWWGITTGTYLNFGHTNDKGNVLNWMLGLNYGAQGVQADIPPDTPVSESWMFVGVHQHLLMGFACIAGYKYTSHQGLTLLYYLGMCYAHNSISDHPGYYFLPSGGLGIGYQFRFLKKARNLTS